MGAIRAGQRIQQHRDYADAGGHNSQPYYKPGKRLLFVKSNPFCYKSRYIQ